MSSWHRFLTFALSAALLLTAADVRAQVDPLDWPQWRGPEQNGISREKNLVDKWSPDEPGQDNLIWKNEELGTISTPIIMNGKLYVLTPVEHGTPLAAERVVCVDAATGKMLWENRFNVFLSDVPAERVAWSNVAGDPETGNVYAMGVAGLFQCIDGETGKTLWSRSLSEEFGYLSTYGGRTNTPVLFEDLVIISGVTTAWGDLARPAHRYLAFDKSNGETVWVSGTRLSPEDTTYSTPVLTSLNGQAAMVFGSGDGAVYAMQPRTGKIIWKFQLSKRGINTSPVVEDDVVYMTQSEENITDTSMGTVIAIDGKGSGDITQTGTIWRVDNIMSGKSSPLLVDGRLYTITDSGTMYVFDAKTGEQVGRTAKLGTSMRSSPVWADGKIYACSASGVWHVLEVNEDGVRILERQRLGSNEECQAAPSISHGRIYLATINAIYCIGNPDQEAVASERSVAPAKASSANDTTPAFVQIVPADVLMEPTEAVQFEARVFNAHGERLADVPAAFTVSGGGEIDKTGRFTPAASADHAATIVTARVGEVQGTARARIVPALPWKFDFSDRQVPITWIGARYRHNATDLDGEPVIVKVTTIPKGTRSQTWMGPTELHDYTVQADVRGAVTDRRMPDIGIIAQRYTLDMMGASQQLQIRTWPPQLRMAKTIPFNWKPNVWYTMKLQASVENNQAVLRGKVWERDQSEPKEWTIEATDPIGNLNGSPGLYGNATNAEIFVDNVAVYPNPRQIEPMN